MTHARNEWPLIVHRKDGAKYVRREYYLRAYDRENEGAWPVHVPSRYLTGKVAPHYPVPSLLGPCYIHDWHVVLFVADETNGNLDDAIVLAMEQFQL